MEARRSRGLDEAFQPKLRQYLVQRARYLDDMSEGSALGVEIENQPVRTFKRVDPGAPKVKRNGAHVDHVEQGFQIIHYDVADVAVGIFRIDLFPAHPARNKFRGILLKERFARYAVGIPR